MGEEEHLIAVAGSATNSTTSVCEAADQTIRSEIEGFAHVIVASSAAQPEFWLGQRDLFETVRVAAVLTRLQSSVPRPDSGGSDVATLFSVAFHGSRAS